MNSRGFVIPPLLIWVIVGILALSAINKTYFEGGTPYEQSDLAKFNPTLDTTETPSPSPIPLANSSDLIKPVEQFYSLLSSKEFEEAWNLVSKGFQDYSQGYDHFVNGYKTTLNTLIKDIRVQDLSNNTVYVQIEAKDNINGQVQTKTFEGIWRLVPDKGQWKLDSADIALKSVSPIPETTKVLIPTLTPNSANTPITHDGSRIGAFVQYNEWATGQKIQIYENELLLYTFPNGNQTYMTKGDIAWFEKNAKPNLVNSTNNLPSEGGYYPTYTPPSNLNNSYYPTYETPPLTFSREDPQINIIGGADSYTRYGNTVYGNDGSSYTQYGNTVYGNDGSSYTQYGNTIYGNDGSSWTKYGNTTYGNDGTSYTQYGNTTYGNDGSSFTRYGNTLYIQPGY